MILGPPIADHIVCFGAGLCAGLAIGGIILVLALLDGRR